MNRRRFLALSLLSSLGAALAPAEAMRQLSGPSEIAFTPDTTYSAMGEIKFGGEAYEKLVDMEARYFQIDGCEQVVEGPIDSVQFDHDQKTATVRFRTRMKF